MSATGSSSCAVERHGHAARELDLDLARRLSGLERAGAKTQADSGMLPFESSVSVPPIVTPQRPRLIEYAEPVIGTGSLRSSKNFTCAARAQE